MVAMIGWLIIIGCIFASSYWALKPRYLALILMVLLLAYSYWQILTITSLTILWLLMAIIILIGCIPIIRRKVISVPVMRWFVRQQPTLSVMEQEVIEAGGTFFEQEFLGGNLNWQALYDMRVTPLTDQEQSFLDNEVTTLCNMLNDWDINHKNKDIPKKAWEYIKNKKMWGLCLDSKYGGLGFSHAAHSAIVSKIATCSITAAYTVMVPNSIGPAEIILHAGTQAQKDYYLPRLAIGEEIGCFALTSPDAGSDAASLTDIGIIGYGQFEGNQVLGITINCEKRYITLAPVATLIALAFDTKDPSHLIGDQEDVGISVALIPVAHPGVSTGNRHCAMHLGLMNGPISGQDIFIPIDWVVGGVAKCGRGWQILMECLSVGRGISMPALADAIGRQCFLMTGSYSELRRQFHRRISEFEGVQEALAKIGGFAYLITATRYMTTQAVVDGNRPAVASAISKYHLTELSRKILRESMDIHCGHALQTGPSNVLAELYNGVLISTVGEGANIITRNLIIFGQGLVRAHPFLKDEIEAAKDVHDIAAQRRFDQLLCQHMSFICTQLTRACVSGLTRGRSFKISVDEQGWLQHYLIQINRISNMLILFSDVTLLVLGKKFKIKESLSARLGDILSYCYLSSAVIKYYIDHGRADDERPVVEYALQYCLHSIKTATDQFINNFPRRWIVKSLRFIMYPGGLNYPYPTDRLSKSVASMMVNDSELRNRFLQETHLGEGSHDVMLQLEVARQAMQNTQPIFDKLMTAINDGHLKRTKSRSELIRQACQQGIITMVEQQKLLEMETLRSCALNVNEFLFDDMVNAVDTNLSSSSRSDTQQG